MILIEFYAEYILNYPALDTKTIKAKSELGVYGFVLGTSVLFGKEQTYEQIIKELRS